MDHDYISPTGLARLLTRIDKSDGTPGGLLAKLVAFESDSDGESSSHDESCKALAEQGRYWTGDGFGCKVYEHLNGFKEIEWGCGSEYTHCSLGDVIEAASGELGMIPDWFQDDWVEVQDKNGRWTSRSAVEYARQLADDVFEQRGQHPVL